MNIILTLLIILTVTSLFSLISKKIKIPQVVGLIIAGLILGYPFIKNIIVEPNSEIIASIGTIGLFSLMFLAGLESSWRTLVKEKKDAFYIAIFGTFTPFLIGFLVFYLIGFSITSSLVIGICMSITAEATKARVLLELKKLKTKIGSAIMGAGILDDILGLSMFFLVTYFFKQIYIKEDLIIGGAILCFFIGIFIQKNIGRDNPTLQKIEKILLWTIVPFLFVSIGLRFDMNSLLLNPGLLILIILIATSGKLIGAFLTKPFTNFKLKQLHLIGWAMNSRGAIEMALALIALQTGMITSDIYSSLVIMALVTTLTFPFIIKTIIKNNPKIMD